MSEKKIIIFIVIVVVILAGLGWWFGVGRHNNPLEKNIDYVKYEAIGLTRHKIDGIFTRIEEHNQLIAENPTDINNWFQKGSLYKVLGEYDLARENFDKVIEINPEFGPTYAEMAELQVHPFGEFEAAVENYKLAIEKAPYRPDYYRWLADLYVAKFPEKKGEIEQLILDGIEQIPTNDQDLYVYLAYFFDREGDVQKAVYYMQKGLDLVPNNETFQKALAELKDKL